MVKFVSNMYHGSHRCLFCHVRTGSIILTASYTVVWTVMAGFELVRLFRPDSRVDVSMVGIRLEGIFHGADTFTPFIFDVFMTVLSGLGVYGIIKFYFPERDSLIEPGSTKAMIAFTFLFLCVMGLKSFFIYSTWNCFKFIKELEQESSLVDTLLNLRSRTQPPAYEDIMKLPLYEEVVKAPEELPHKKSPPSYTPK
ncbi:lysosomal-associated transmembrane protein 4A-like isoform X2 [Stegostoma tigrinum]|uniref:lysosomal-associated transmembrane protein 4A-like isoform X2 n=1 Tax=Stegostoma tigrinum TaxID=3053191 RepID=UPI00202B78D2|nr:lysosomal-associated transmembrane protein 4A-like isoform X2 [Stegostoma tigrinum]